MKKLIHPILLIVVSCTLLQLFSCGTSGSNDNKDKDTKNDGKHTELQAFMLGGIYFINGYGGSAAFDRMITANGDDKDNVIEAAEHYLIFPFAQDDSQDVKTTLSGMWDINTKEELIKTLEELKNHSMQSSYTKAWDYARYVNNVCMGYAAGFLTKDEGKKLVTGILPLAQADYKTWSEYFTDFAAGRNKWKESGNGDTGNDALADLSQTITQGNNNIFSIIPLH